MDRRVKPGDDSNLLGSDGGKSGKARTVFAWRASPNPAMTVFAGR
jgi:hypothetical protein